ncbi:MAG: hypothetical protein JW806_09415, partial [Sedimentisphaerales bacterium]|nr:hypothetical protein [Sedimentisphaerales bacterium]
MRTKAGVVILLIILFANSVFAQFPIWNKAESQECSVYFQPDSSNSREKTGTTKYEPFTNERLETDLIFKSSVLDGDYQLRTELDGAVYVNSDITSNTIWTADNTYYVLQLIDVNSAMLVIEPGTTIKFVAGVNAGIRVLNGGTIISRGTPNKPILFTSDASSPWISDYYYAIRIDETASTAS